MYRKPVSFTSYAGKKNIGQSFQVKACPMFLEERGEHDY